MSLQQAEASLPSTGTQQVALRFRKSERAVRPFARARASLTGVAAIPYNCGPFGELAQLVRAEES